MKDTIETFTSLTDNPRGSISSHKFISSLLDYEVDDGLLREVFNGFHSQCPNFQRGSNDCPDCIAQHGFEVEG
jgi:hypothetical protein